MDDQLLGDMRSPYTGADIETSQEFIPDTFHGTEVIVQASGTVKLVGRYGDVLFFRMSTKQGQVLSKMRKPANTAGGTLWENGELQRKLRQGAIFKCTAMKNGTEDGRVCVRGGAVPEVLAPPEADFNTVAIQCEVTLEGTQHENQCGTSLEDGDQARRLGVMLKYTCGRNNKAEECWAKLKGTCNAKKLNSLVDFLDGKDDDWTAEQPRRFLDRYRGKGGRRQHTHLRVHK